MHSQVLDLELHNGLRIWEQHNQLKTTLETGMKFLAFAPFVCNQY
jgi:hypothetical protein